MGGFYFDVCAINSTTAIHQLMLCLKAFDDIEKLSARGVAEPVAVDCNDCFDELYHHTMNSILANVKLCCCPEVVSLMSKMSEISCYALIHCKSSSDLRFILNNI